MEDEMGLFHAAAPDGIDPETVLCVPPVHTQRIVSPIVAANENGEKSEEFTSNTCTVENALLHVSNVINNNE